MEGFEPSPEVLETTMLNHYTTLLYLSMPGTHISLHPTLKELFLGIQEVVIPFIKILPVSLVYIVPPFIPEVIFKRLPRFLYQDHP